MNLQVIVNVKSVVKDLVKELNVKLNEEGREEVSFKKVINNEKLIKKILSVIESDLNNFIEVGCYNDNTELSEMIDNEIINLV